MNLKGSRVASLLLSKILNLSWDKPMQSSNSWRRLIEVTKDIRVEKSSISEQMCHQLRNDMELSNMTSNQLV